MFCRFSRKRLYIPLFWTLTTLILHACNNRPQADLLIHGGKIYLADSAFSTAEAMVLHQEKILETGTLQHLRKKYTIKEELDVKGNFVYPGFIDAHCHFTGFATDMWKCHLEGSLSIDDMLQKVVDYSKSAQTEWIYGRGWDQSLWKDNRFPDNTKLDSLFPNRPVFLKRIDGHAALANSLALKRAGINENTVFKHGTAEKKDGRLTGLLIDEAMEKVDAVIPGISDEMALAYFDSAQRLCLSVGLTGLHDCGISEHTFRLLQKMDDANQLRMHVYALLSDSIAYYDRWLQRGVYRSPNLVMGGFKWYGDGALGSRGACLMEDYSDKPGWRGTLLRDPDYFKSLASKLASSSLQVCAHAIGDSANRVMLQLFGAALKNEADRRWRIEHAQVVHPDDVPLFGRHDIVPSVQPTHATTDMRWVDARLGSERSKHAYAYKTLLQQNGWLPLGTDFPVEGIDPLKTFYAAVTRKTPAGEPSKGFFPEQALSREEALMGITAWAARAGFSEKERGSLQPGRYADFVILNKDLLECKEEEILQAEILFTFIRGMKVFEKEKAIK